MNVTLYNFDNNEIKEVDKTLEPAEWPDKVHWVEIRYTDRSKAVKYLQAIPSINDSIDFLVKPEDHTLPKTDKDFLMQNLVFSQKENFYQSDYFTLIVLKETVISIIPKSANLKLNQPQPKNLKGLFTDLKYYFAYTLISDVLTRNISNLSEARKKLNIMEDMLLRNPDKLRSQSVMESRNDISQLADIIEDQYVSLNILFSFLNIEEKKNDIKKLKELLYGFKEINRIMARLEEKAESFRTQFMLIHQEESAHKINILTILQAIFIPLTFIAGVYGMNFKYMPELNGEHSYFIVLGLFIVLAGSLLLFFKKNGWFD
jgi:Mg2+ and Co2+ transporter CorA